MQKRFFVFWVVVGCLSWGTVLANRVSYQGILTNVSGDSLLTGTYDFSFSIFSSETGGAARWTEAHPDVEVENGVYSVLLGGATALPDSIGPTNWLQIAVEGVTLTPRLPINADFRAIEAKHAQNSDSVGHFAARSTPAANHLLPLDATGKFPESVLPFSLDSILAGQGLTGTVNAPGELRGGRNSLDERLTLNVGAGTGIAVTADQVSAVLGTSISTSELEDLAVDSLKLDTNSVRSENVQDNALTAADIQPNIVSSLDGVVNDGGNVDLIAGANITIVPNDVNNTITFSAAGGGGGYSAGRCIELAGTVINNTMGISAGDSCIRVVFDPATCTYQLSSDLDVYAGNCIEIEYDDVSCDWTVSVDPACVDSIYDTEFYAESFVVIGDGTVEEPRAHLRNDGGLELRDGDGNEVYINPNGTMVIVQDGVPVGGYDANGEFYAQSFMVIDPETGDTISHLTNDGGLELFGEDGAVLLNPNGSIGVFQNGELVAGLDNSGEHFARSFMVIDSAGDTLAHLDRYGGLAMQNNGYVADLSPGGLFIGDSAGNSGAYLDYNGTIAAFRDGQQIMEFSPFTGELTAQSFEVRDSVNGVLIAHLDNDGNLALPDGAQVTIGGVPIGGGGIGDEIEFANGPQSTEINAAGLTVSNSDNGNTSEIGTLGVVTSNEGSNSGVHLSPDGTWSAGQNGVNIAGLHSNGEMYAKSFEVKDSSSGAIKAHLDNDGNLALPDGAQITIGGVPIGGGGIGDEIEFEVGSNSSYMNAEGVSIADENANTALTAANIAVANNSNTSYVDLQQDGTWEAKQNGVIVASLQSNGEIHAKSFEVRDSLNGALKAHLTNSGGLSATGTISGQYVTGTTSVYSQSVSGNTTLFSDLTPGYLRSQVLLSNVQQSGWTFFNNGTMQQWIDPAGPTPPMLNMQTTADGYWQFGMPVFFGNPANFNYLSGGTIQQGVMTSGNFTINGKANVTGAVDPIICELFPAHPGHAFVPGTVVVADRNSDYVVPCHDSNQSGVIGVVTADEKVDDRGHIMVTILGYAAAFRQDGTRLEMRVKADAQYGAIKRGDLLTTSPTSGHAMVAAEPKLGTIVGKALESLDKGTGDIRIMVTLQ